MTTGNLRGHAEWGMAFWDSNDVIRKAIWPAGFGARYEPDGRLALIDGNGEVVAYEHDLVDLTGDFADGTWMVCSITDRTQMT